MKKLLLPALAIIVCGLVAFALFANQRPAATPFSLLDLNKQPVSEKQLQGKVTLINFWYPSCPGCVIEMPKLIDTQAKFAGTAYQTIAISLPFNTEAEVRAYVNEQLHIRSQFKKIGHRSAVMEQVVCLKDSDTVVADATITFVLIDIKTGKALTLDGDVATALNRLLEPAA